MAHKTFKGMANAVEILITRIEGSTISDDREYKTTSKKVDLLLDELNSLWSNPADRIAASKLKSRLVDAWNAATV